MRELLGHRDFRMLLAGQTLSMFGDWTLLLVFGIWARTLTGSNAIAGLMVFAMAAPALLGPLGGVLVDRLPRRRVMVVVNLASAVLVLALWLVHDRRQLWLLVVVAVGYGLGSVVFNAALTGLVQSMLPVGLIGPANGALATVRQGLRLVGPLLGAGLFAAFGGRWVATLDAVTFVGATVALLALRHRELPAARTRSSFRTEVTAGLTHLRRTPVLRRLSVATVVWGAAFGLSEAAVYALVADGLHRPATFVGVLVSVQGAGAILGGILVSTAIRRYSEPAMIVSGLAAMTVGAGLCAVPALATALAGFGIFGLGMPVLTVAAGTLLQRSTPNAIMGRVAAGYEVVSSVPYTAFIAIGAGLIGIGPWQPVIGSVALGCALAGLAVLSSRRHWHDPVAPVGAVGTRPFTEVTR